MPSGERNQRVLYVPGLTVDRARDAYRGESKTDARDAHLIADQSRTITRLREALLSLFPALERALDLQPRVCLRTSPSAARVVKKTQVQKVA